MKRSLWFSAMALLPALLGGCIAPPAPATDPPDDLALSTRVREALSAQQQLNAGGIQVENHTGVVELSGTVATDAQRESAVQTARRVEGVKSVKDSLKVQ